MLGMTVSQSEIDALLDGGEELEPLEEEKEVKHIWIVKNKSFHGAVVGGRNYSYFQAQQVMEKAMKEHPGDQMEIIQLI